MTRLAYIFIGHVLFVVCLAVSKPAESHKARGTSNELFPFVLVTWPFTKAADTAWEVLQNGESALDAVEAGCSTCEKLQCDGTVGFGGSPNELGETTLDAMIIDGTTHRIGAVASMHNIKNAVTVARAVLERTEHTLLVGHDATNFAISMGQIPTNLSTTASLSKWHNWKAKDCQPNYWRNVVPDPKKSCGPYKPSSESASMNENESAAIELNNHDTIGMVAIDSDGHIAAGTSTNGMTFKIPGRVGDAPIPGSGAYVDKDVGGCAATGDGDVMMRFLPCFHTVLLMKMGLDPTTAAEKSIHEILRYYPKFAGSVVAVNMKGEYGSACANWDFSYSIANPTFGRVHVQPVQCRKV